MQSWRRMLRMAANRRYILVQLPEPLDPENKEQKTAADFCDKLGKPRTIAELTKERLRRAAAKVKADNPLFAGDTGFRVFKLDHSNIRAWNPNPADLEQTLFAHQDHLIEDRTESDILYELLLKLGLDLCVPIEQRTINGKDVHSVGGGVLMACLAQRSPATRWSPLRKASSTGTRNWRLPVTRPACSATAPSPTTWRRPIWPQFWSSTASRTCAVCEGSI